MIPLWLRLRLESTVEAARLSALHLLGGVDAVRAARDRDALIGEVAELRAPDACDCETCVHVDIASNSDPCRSCSISQGRISDGMHWERRR